MKEITMPKLSDTMTEGTVITWLKAVGATVERGEVIAEVETDKATMELEAFASGVLLEIRVEAGKNVPVGTVIGLIGAPEERTAKPAGEAEDATAPESAAKPAEHTAAAPARAPQSKTEPEVGGPKEDKETEPATAGAAGEVRAAPVVRRRAQELGIDLTSVTGSGPEGRVRLEDLEPATTTARAQGEPKPREAAAETAATGAGREGAAAPSEAQPLSRMRAAIARTVTESWRTIPHFSVAVEVRMDAAEQLRQERKEPPVSLTALLVRATALALQQFPRLNASLVDDRLVIHPDIHIGIVARRDDGLLVPVLRDCAGLALAETARRTAQLVARARDGQLSHTELSGGTFAISNLGMFDVHSFVALILPPMAAVLAVGAVRNGVVAQDGEPAVARLLTLTLSADHRLVDGVYAAEFLRVVKQLLEDPARLDGG